MTELIRKSSYSFEELLECAHGRLFGDGNAQLPLPPFLMFDRITNIAAEGGLHGKGNITAEMDIKPELWFFKCHFENDPVMPGCLGVDAMWQMVGFFLGWLGGLGRGRALSVGKVKFSGQVLNTAKKLTYMVDIKRVIRSRLTMGIAEGRMMMDGKPVYEADDIRVGLFAPSVE